MKARFLTIVVLTGLFALSCNKYDNGPALSLRSKKERIANNWRIAQVIDDGVDVTDDYQNYKLNLSKSGSADLYVKYSFLGSDFEYNTTGSWVFMDRKEKIYMNFENDDADETYRITKLLEDELWLRDEAENREFKLIPQ